VLLPWLVFAANFACFALLFRHHAKSCWLGAFWCVAAGSVAVIVRERRGCRPNFLRVLGVYCIFATGIGVSLGFYTFDKYVSPFTVYREGRWYNNVLPSDHPGAKKDGGILTFSFDTYIDPVKGVGFRNGDLFCVAPIVSQNADRNVGYWAVGKNCCRPRGLFKCGDAWNENAKSAMMMYETGSLEVGDMTFYKKAVEEAAAAYEFTVPEEPTFVRWVADPEAELEALHAGAVRFLWYGLGASLLLWALAAILAWELENQRFDLKFV